MKTRFFFTLPVVAMIAMTTTVANATECKVEVDRPIGPRMVEVASINKVDAKVDAKTVLLAGWLDFDQPDNIRLAEVRDKVDTNINKLNPNQKNQDLKLCARQTDKTAGRMPGGIPPIMHKKIE